MTNWRSRFLRRRALLSDSLQYGNALTEGLDLLTESLTEDHLWSNDTKGELAYYSSRASKGIDRLRENLVESIAWTDKLYRVARSRLFLKSVLTVGCAAAMAAAIIFVGKGALDSTSAVQLLSVVLVFIASAEQFDAVGTWTWASEEARRLRQSLELVGDSTTDEQAKIRVWASFSDYAVLTSVAPAIPRALYERHKAKLEALSASILSSRKGANSEYDSGTSKVSLQHALSGEVKPGGGDDQKRR